MTLDQIPAAGMVGLAGCESGDSVGLGGSYRNELMTSPGSGPGREGSHGRLFMWVRHTPYARCPTFLSLLGGSWYEQPSTPTCTGR